MFVVPKNVPGSGEDEPQSCCEETETDSFAASAVSEKFLEK